MVTRPSDATTKTPDLCETRNVAPREWAAAHAQFTNVVLIVHDHRRGLELPVLEPKVHGFELSGLGGFNDARNKIKPIHSTTAVIAGDFQRPRNEVRETSYSVSRD